jgi:hypothetical protein
MNRLSKILTLVLAVQLLLVAAAFWPRSNEGENTARTPLLEITAAEIDAITISDKDDSLLLSRTEQGWQLPNYHSLPIETAKLNRTLEDLPTLSRGWPVAASAGARERFEVAEDGFQRRVDYFEGGEKSGSIYLGTSPGFRKVHTRVDNSDPVYAVEFNNYDLPVQAAEWLDKSLLQLRQVDAIAGLDYSIRKEGDSWVGDGDITPEQTEVDKLFNGLTGLRVTAAADIATAAVLEEMNAPPTLTAQSGGTAYEYRLFEIEDAYYIQRSDIPVYFSLGQFDYDRLNDVNAASLYPAPAASEEAATTGGTVGEG